MTALSEQPLSGAELVLIAQVPKAGARWYQVHFNKDVMREFFRLRKGDDRRVTVERVNSDGSREEQVSRQLVLSSVNLNPKLELDFGMREGKRQEYPGDGVPLVVVLELDMRAFRYQTLMPGEAGHVEMLELNCELPSIGKGLPRVISTLDEVELRWPGCRLRSPREV